MWRALLKAVGLMLVVSSGLSAEVEIVHIDVDQGDSIFVRGPNGTTVLIDAGGGVGNTGHPKENIYAVLDAYGQRS